MKSTKHLIKIAELLSIKYADIQAESMRDKITKDIYTAIANASNVKVSGIMPFMKMLEQDQASLTINITRSGSDIEVSIPRVSNYAVAQKYYPLADQIKTYLERYLELYPSRRNGESIRYSNFTITLEFPSAQSGIGSGIAQK